MLAKAFYQQVGQRADLPGWVRRWRSDDVEVRPSVASEGRRIGFWIVEQAQRINSDAKRRRFAAAPLGVLGPVAWKN